MGISYIVLAGGKGLRLKRDKVLENIEKAILDGDTDTTHMDADVTGATDARKSWDGYRKLTQSAAKVSISTFTGEALMNIRKAMLF